MSSEPRRVDSDMSAPAVMVYGIVDDALSAEFPLGVELETFMSRELEAGGLN